MKARDGRRELWVQFAMNEYGSDDQDDYRCHQYLSVGIATIFFLVGLQSLPHFRNGTRELNPAGTSIENQSLVLS